MDPSTLCKLPLIVIFINSGLLNKGGNDKITVWYDGTELERNSWLVAILLHYGSGRKLVLRSKFIKASLCSSRVEIRAFRLLETWGTNSSVTLCLVPEGTEVSATSLLQPNNSKSTSQPYRFLCPWQIDMRLESIVFCLWFI